jgi:hypothetical protein
MMLLVWRYYMMSYNSLYAPAGTIRPTHIPVGHSVGQSCMPCDAAGMRRVLHSEMTQ